MQLTASDTIRILVSTDNHVGYGERDPIRHNDSWKTFDEVMVLAKKHDVDMVVLAGDLFHENKPSRQAMYQVTRSLRANCLGDKPCELEILSDKTEAFEGTFDHVNYEDEDINVAIPVFSIHGNHDDPTGGGHLAALDLLQVGGLVNYYGRTHESDNIYIKPVLLQKGRTKLALYGMSNVRDERLFRTFRDGKVKFFQPSQQKSDWFNLMSVHQNRHAYTETSYLPENFLPNWMDLVIWGHEHESLIYPHPNAETCFDVIQPGSTVATSLVEAEAKPKHACILSITGRDFKSQPIRLKTVRPFKIRDVALAEDPVTKKLAKKEDNRGGVTDRLIEIVEEMIEEAITEWQETQEETEPEEDLDPPLPLIRLRVEYTAPEGGTFDCENPQRFSNRFVKRVANTTDVVQFWRKKKAATRNNKGVELPKESMLHSVAPDSVDFAKLVREFLGAQSLTMLPQNSFRDAVKQFVDKDDKHAMEEFVSANVKTQVKHLLSLDEEDEDKEDIAGELEANRERLEALFEKGHRKKHGRRIREKPAAWDTDLDGEWNSDVSGAVEFTDAEDDQASDNGDQTSIVSKTPAPRGRGRTNGTAKTAAAKKTTTRATKAAPASKTAQSAKSTRGRKKQVVDEDEYEVEENNDGDVVMGDADDPNNSQLYPLFVQSQQQAPKKPAPKSKAAPAKKAPARKAAAPTPARSQVSLRSGIGVSRKKEVQEISDDIEDDDDDDEDAFEPVPARKKGRGKQ